MDASPSWAQDDEKGEYEIFINFHGGDVRWGFLSHLIRALKLKQINAFYDNKLTRTESFNTELLRKIEQTNVSIVIFSKNYPKSEYCMIELEKIQESRELRGHKAFPVFHKVETDDVQKLQGNYGAVTNQKWKDALQIISCISGADYKQFGNEADLVDFVVTHASKILGDLFPNISNRVGLFGISSSVKDVEDKLQFDSMNTDVKMVGIWGMKGIGKTTIADQVFHRNKQNFPGHCFVSNVRETFERDGPMSIREKIIRSVLRDESLKIDSSTSVDDSTLRRIKREKVLLVLDDVLNSSQLELILRTSGLCSPDSFCQGSRIILTSTDQQVMKDVVFENEIYPVIQLKDTKAQQLFCWTAFGQTNPKQGYERFLEKAVRYGGGIPQVLIILGSELKHKSIKFWERALAKYRTISPVGGRDFLRISINQGLDSEERKIFLDIACFLKGNTRDYVEKMLETFGFHAMVGIERLIDKALVKEEEKDRGVIITMHDLLEQAGKEIVNEEKESKGHGSRLWTFDDVKNALRNNKGTENVEVISLDFRYGDDRVIEINPEAFIHMFRLRFLKFKKNDFEFNSVLRTVDFPDGLKIFLPSSINYLEWENLSQNYWPFDYDTDNLVELHLKHSRLEEIIWSKPLLSLKVIVLSDSKALEKISDLAMAPNLEVIDLRGCESLSATGSSLENLNNLTELNVTRCMSLSCLPELPCSLVKLNLSYSGIRKLPATIGDLISLEVLDLSYCYGLVEIESSLENLKKLTRLDVRGCTRLSLLPELPSSIVELELSRSGLKRLPSTIGNLIGLKELRCYLCGELKTLPRSICNLTSLETLDLSDCKNLKKLPEDLGNLKLLQAIYASDSGLTELPPSIQNLENLKQLELTGCRKLESLPSLPSNIELLFARRCKSSFSAVKSSIVERYRQQVHDQPTKIRRLCVDDGRQVPEWMKYRNDSGSFVSLDPKTIADSTNLVFFVVITSTNTEPDIDYISSIYPVAILTDQNGQTYESCAYQSGEGPKTIHLDGETPSYFILWNCNIEYKFLKSVSFEFLFDRDDDKILRCGVHPIFLT